MDQVKDVVMSKTGTEEEIEKEIEVTQTEEVKMTEVEVILMTEETMKKIEVILVSTKNFFFFSNLTHSTF